MYRTRDIVLAGAGVLLLWPLMLVLAVAVRIDSPGHALFRQERVGRDGRPFTMRKFRSMIVSSGGPAVATAGDARITRVGRFLRTTKLDELPQLVDVLRGSMSLVGPRPEVAQYVALWPDDLRPTILSVRPGITDPATALLRHEGVILAQSPDPERTYVEVLLPAKARLYADYVRTRTFRGDIAIVVRTIREILRPTDSDPATALSRLGLEAP